MFSFFLNLMKRSKTKLFRQTGQIRRRWQQQQSLPIQQLSAKSAGLI
jgi:hypothetical protein